MRCFCGTLIYNTVSVRFRPASVLVCSVGLFALPYFTDLVNGYLRHGKLVPYAELYQQKEKPVEMQIKRFYNEQNKKDFRRERIVNNELLSMVDSVKISDRNKEIVRRYTDGESEAKLAECYGITPNRIASIVANFLWHCSQERNR